MSVFAWGLSTWYCARLLLARRFPHTHKTFFKKTNCLREWAPRVGAGWVFLVVVSAFCCIALSGGAGLLTYFLIAFYLLVGVALVAARWNRRKIFKVRMRDRPAYEFDDTLPSESLRALRISFALSIILIFLFLVFPVKVATALGAPAIFLFGAASWNLFCSMILTYWPLARRYPTLTLPLVIWAILMSWFNDNHAIRSAEPVVTAATRETPDMHFRNWLNSKLDKTPDAGPYPVFVVASAGGGIRAAYWTASVLGRIAEESDGAWADHLYAMSGVSGGSVGCALHTVQIAESAEESERRLASAVTRAQTSLRNDILSPVTAYLLFPDLLQRFLPIGFSATDRARALELALESAVFDPRGVNSQRFARRFIEL